MRRLGGGDPFASRVRFGADVCDGRPFVCGVPSSYPLVQQTPGQLPRQGRLAHACRAVDCQYGRAECAPLSVAALETLAVVAYKQPVTGPEIADIRGVNTAGVLGTLLERKLIKIVGRKQVVGRPFLYGTTREFLERFGLNDLSDLPKVEDMSDLLGFDLPASVAETAPQSPLPFEPENPAEEKKTIH